MLAACTAKRWLARNAASVKRIRCDDNPEASACVSLVSCLPALEHVDLCLAGPLENNDLGCLLETLTWCPRLSALSLCVDCVNPREGGDDLQSPFPAGSAFTRLSSLASLGLTLDSEIHYTVAEVLGALVSLTGLADLSICFALQPGVVPAALRQLKALQSLELHDIRPCVLEAGCLDLPKLESLVFGSCNFVDAKVLPGVSALQCLTRIELSGGSRSSFFDPQLVQLPLQRLVLCRDSGFAEVSTPGIEDVSDDAPLMLRLPAGMGLLIFSLLHLDVSGVFHSLPARSDAAGDTQSSKCEGH